MNTNVTEIQQSALFGHAIADFRVFDALQALNIHVGATAGLDAVPTLAALWTTLATFHAAHKRHPSETEFRGEVREPSQVKYLDFAITTKSEIPYEAIQPAILRIAERAAVRTKLQKVVDLFGDTQVATADDTKHTEMLDVISNLGTEIANLRTLSGGSKFKSMAERVRGEETERLSRGPRIIQTGVSYLDESSGGGIGPMDLWTISATTGSGKTQLMTSVAEHTGTLKDAEGKLKYRVAMFALEAEPNELERRIQFTKALKAYNLANKGNHDFIDGARWRNGLEPETSMLKKYIPKAIEEMESLGNIDTFYLGYGKYKAQDLERDVLAASKQYDLIIIDHIGYIALDSGNENKEVTDLMFMLRDVSRLGRGIPILMAAHVRKAERTPRKYAPLMIDREDVKGSSAIIQCSTHVVLISKIQGIDVEHTPIDLTTPSTTVDGPTFMRMSKMRHADRDAYTAVCSYDRKSGGYRDKYAIGRIEKADTQWTQTSPAPEWAKSGTRNVKPISREEKKQ